MGRLFALGLSLMICGPRSAQYLEIQSSNFHLRLLQRVTHTLPSNPVHTSTYEGVVPTRIQAIQSRGVTLGEPLVSFEFNGAVAVYVNIIIVISGVR